MPSFLSLKLATCCGGQGKETHTPRKLNSFAPEILPDLVAEPPPEEPSKKNLHAVALVRPGGIKAGKARAAKLTPKQRKEFGRKGAAARWEKSCGISVRKLLDSPFAGD